ncbi:MAG: BamA/TamA family outer membrane protein [Deltaproteobacteria bacterium]|nr:BamA/TamA family outer membrane protein [Deltaproteobacteria bacterium]
MKYSPRSRAPARERIRRFLRSRRSFFIFTAIFWATLLICQPLCHAQQYRVCGVALNGVGFMEKADLLQTLVTRSRPSWKFWTPWPKVNEKDLDDDVLRILKFYHDRGYFLASARYEKKIVDSEKCALRAESGEESPAAPCRIKVIFHVQKGLPVAVGTIGWEISGESLTISAARLEKEIKLSVGKIFTSEDYEVSKVAVGKFLANRGYPFADITGKVRIDLKARRADVLFYVKMGRVHTFGDIRIKGNNGFVKKSVFDRAMTIVPGKPYDGRKIDESRSALFNLGVFDAALIQAEKPAPNKEAVPIRVRVKPKKRHSVEAGVGYGTDDGIRLRGAWRYRNLTGHADRFSISARRSNRLEAVSADYRYPYFLDRKNILKAGAGLQTDDETFYDLRTIYGETSVRRRFSGVWSGLVTCRFSVLDPNNVSSGATGVYTDTRSRFRVSSVTAELDFNQMDNELSPTSGSYVNLSIETASSAIGSGLSYYRPEFEGAAYIPVLPGVVLAGHVFFRTIHETEDTPDIPIFLKSFMGGSKTVRGYGYHRLNVYDNDIMVALGGLSAALANLELRYPVFGDFSGVVFVDAGALSSKTLDIDWRNARYTCGAGLRYHTVIGPIQADIGYKFNPPKGSALTGEAAETTRWHFHLNIGHAF